MEAVGTTPRTGDLVLSISSKRDPVDAIARTMEDDSSKGDGSSTGYALSSANLDFSSGMVVGSFVGSGSSLLLITKDLLCDNCLGVNECPPIKRIVAIKSESKRCANFMVETSSE